ncbi:MAG: leader peptidase (prepilin peptidase) / N-methyltransferase [Halothiobacillaceae bacterium]|nr:MAG: leader peptidase (prepilin peptidase) / N-methyltransferase [Halothiobacillaceae bacterium]
MDIITLLGANSLFLLFFTALIGLLIGSFLNVVIYRLPLMMEKEWHSQCRELLKVTEDVAPSRERFDLITPRSRCPQCGHSITALENIPVISYLFLRGRCRSCQVQIPLRYPLIELSTALLSALVVWKLGFTATAGAALLLTWALIALSVIDFDHQLLPDDITLPMVWIGLLLSLFGLFTDSSASIIGGIAGYLSLWTLFHLFKLLTGKEGMGYGDFKLFALFGTWFGWQALPAIILCASLVGAIVGTALITLRGRDKNSPIPFGPYLAAAGWLYMLWGEAVVSAYLRANHIN